jgi:DNA-directed RNA polymerase specialized sigma24 family protein
MGESGCGDRALIAGEAAELFQLAALLVGDEAEAAALVVEVVSASDIDPCQETESLRKAARLEVLQTALAHLRERRPGSLAPPSGPSVGGCIDNDDLSASGVSPSQLQAWLAGDGRHDLRQWLEQLPTAQRAVFVQRAVLGQDSDTAALVLREVEGDGGASSWTAETVGETFRMALCSLANRVAHSPAASSAPAGSMAATA